MDPTAALIAGLVAGFAIAMQVGAVSLLLIEASIASGPRAGVAAGMGVATADFAYAVVAAAAGGVVGAALSSHESEIKVVAAVTLAAIAIHGLLKLRAERRGVDAATDGGADTGDVALRGAPATHYARVLAITAANPLTIASFAAVAAALSLDGTGAAAAFAVGVGLASAGWHLVLTLAAGHAGRWITPRIRRGLAIGGRLAVLAIAAHLAF
jgi:threonine/homoserine/homoserine lactone efflux protein